MTQAYDLLSQIYICIAVYKSDSKSMDKCWRMRNLAKCKWMTHVTCTVSACGVQVQGTIDDTYRWWMARTSHARDLSNGLRAMKHVQCHPNPCSMMVVLTQISDFTVLWHDGIMLTWKFNLLWFVGICWSFFMHGAGELARSSPTINTLCLNVSHSIWSPHFVELDLLVVRVQCVSAI